MNAKVTGILVELSEIESGKELCLTLEGNHFRLYHGSRQVGEDLTLSELKILSNNATRGYDIVQLLDVSQVVSLEVIKITDGFLKIEDGLPMVFLHVLHRVKFQRIPSKQVLPAITEVG